MRPKNVESLRVLDEPEEQDEGVQRRKGEEPGSNRPCDNRLCDQKRSTTDPDETFERKGKTAGMGYKTNIGADSLKGVITDVTVSTDVADDNSAVPELLDKHCDELDEMTLRVVADGDYGSQDCLAYVQNKGIETVIKKRSGGNKHRGYDKSSFVYDSGRDIFTCPAGSQLRRIRTDIKKSKRTTDVMPAIVVVVFNV